MTGRRTGMPVVVSLYSLLDIALEAMRSNPTAVADSVAVWFTHTKAPGGPVLSHGASQIGVLLQTPSGADSSETPGGVY